MQMYLDGTLKVSYEGFLSANDHTGFDEDFNGAGNGSFDFYTGKYYISEQTRWDLPGYMKGSVDNVRFYKRALNKYEIRKLFTDKD